MNGQYNTRVKFIQSMNGQYKDYNYKGTVSINEWTDKIQNGHHYKI